MRKTNENKVKEIVREEKKRRRGIEEKKRENTNTTQTRPNEELDTTE